MTTQDTLPPELINLIVLEVKSSNDLCKLSLCSRDLAAIAQPALFRHPAHAATSRTRRDQFIAAINSSPRRLGRMVREYELTTFNGHPEEDVPDIASALGVMCNLKRLMVCPTPNIATPILQGCTFQLEVLDWRSYVSDDELLFLLDHFLPTQKRMKHLTLYYAERRTDIMWSQVDTRDLCPALVSLETSSFRVLSLFMGPHRHGATRLQWMGEALPPWLPSQSTPLECLSSKLLSPANIAQLKSLVLLELYSLKASTAANAIRDLQFISSLPRLEVFIFDIYVAWPTSPTAEEPYPELWENDEQRTSAIESIISSVFAIRETLKHIDWDRISGRDNLRVLNRYHPPRDGAKKMENVQVNAQEAFSWKMNFTTTRSTTI